MAIGQKLFEQTGKITGSRIIKVHPIDGIVTEVSFMADIKGIDNKFPSGKTIGSGVMTQYPPHGTVDASYQGNIMTTTEEEGGGRDQIFWWAHQKSKVVEEGRKRNGVNIVSFFTNSQKLSWINSIIAVYEGEIDLASLQFKLDAYEWI